MTIKRLRKMIDSKFYHNRQRKRFLDALKMVQMPKGNDELEFQIYLKYVRRCIAQVKWHIQHSEKKAAK